MNGSNSNTSGENVLEVDWQKRGESDRVPDEVMEEISRRLVITMEAVAQGNVIFSPEEPADKTKAWWQTNPQTGIPIGEPKTWNVSQQKWLPIVASSIYEPPARRTLKRVVAAGASTVNFEFEDIKTSNYNVHLIWTTQQSDGSWAPAPASFPNNFGFIIANKSNTTLTVGFYGVPVGGMTAEGYVEEIL